MCRWRWLAVVLALVGAVAAQPRAEPAPERPAYPAWDRMFVKPEAPLRTPGDGGELTLLLYHSYPGPLHHLRLELVPGDVEPAGPPAELAVVQPTEINTVRLKLRQRGVPSTDTTTLRLRFSADEVSGSYEYGLTYPLTAKGSATANRALAMPVGGIPVIVTSRGRYGYVLSWVLFVVLLAWWLERKRRLRAQPKPRAR